MIEEGSIYVGVLYGGECGGKCGCGANEEERRRMGCLNIWATAKRATRSQKGRFSDSFSSLGGQSPIWSQKENVDESEQRSNCWKVSQIKADHWQHISYQETYERILYETEHYAHTPHWLVLKVCIGSFRDTIVFHHHHLTCHGFIWSSSELVICLNCYHNYEVVHLSSLLLDWLFRYL